MRYSFTLSALVAGAIAAPAVQDVSERQIADHWTSSYVLVGDGSPVQAYLYEQVTPWHGCGQEGESCSISNTELTTSTISWSAGIADTLGFISGGFSVSESKSNGFTATCSAGSGDSNANGVCVWGRIAHTGYEVQAYRHRMNWKPTDGEPEGDPLYIWAPNSGTTGHGYLCAHDDECESEGAQWWGHRSIEPEVWNHDRNKGGPTDWVWGTDPADRWN